jgi:exopolyphosphatase/guanosine-5'-triphosphate,3'-diphosphate pyrophosphatase
MPSLPAALSAVFDTLGVHEMRPARGALRVGVLYDLLGRSEQRDVRDATVERLQARFGVDLMQAQQVALIATQLHAALQPRARKDADKRLPWACALHELGFAISHNDYHKHGAYLVQHSDMAGFSTSDQEYMAQLIVGQRGNLKKVAPLLEDAARAAELLALRLAVILCHARRPIELPKWTLRAARAGFELRMEGGWLARHPLTQFLLDEESAQWDKVGLRLAVKPL